MLAPSSTTTLPGQRRGLDPAAITWRRALDVTTVRCEHRHRPRLAPRRRDTQSGSTSRPPPSDGGPRSGRLPPDLRARLGASWSATPCGTPVTAEEIEGPGHGGDPSRRARAEPAPDLEGPPARPHRAVRTCHGQLSVVADLVGIRGSDFSSPRRASRRHGAERSSHQVPRVGLVPDAAVLVATVRSLKGHSATTASWPDDPYRPPLRGGPDEVHVGGANLAKQWRTCASRRPRRRRHQRLPDGPPSEHRRSARSQPRSASRGALCTNVADGGKGHSSWRRRRRTHA